MDLDISSLVDLLATGPLVTKAHRNGKCYDALKLDYNLLNDNMVHVVGLKVVNAMVHAGRVDRCSRRPEQTAECRVMFSYAPSSPWVNLFSFLKRVQLS